MGKRAWTAVTILLTGMTLSCASRPVAPPESSPPSPPRPDPLVIIRGILEQHRAVQERYRAPGRCVSGHPTRQMRDLGFQVTPARLWALSFPQEAEGHALPLAADRGADARDRELAVEIVGVLARRGNARAEALLVDLARSDVDPVRGTATRVLSIGDLQGRHRDLYRHRARQGDFAALEVLGDWDDAASESVLREIASRDNSGPSQFARESLERILWLQRPDWAQTVREFLRGGGVAAFRGFDWAVRVARRRELPELLPLLRERIRAVESEHERWFGALGGVEPCVPNQVPECSFTRSFIVASMDWHFDDALTAYADLGGELTPLEEERLHFLGHGKDPRKRLFELVAPRRTGP